MRVVLDTNVLVSAFISKLGIPAEILDLVVTLQEMRLVLSEEILGEFSDVMNREEVRMRFAYTDEQIFAFVEAIRSVADVVKVESGVNLVKDDPADDIVVNTSSDGNADYIVSGDTHLLKLRTVGKVRVVSPRGFLRIIRQEFGDLILPRGESYGSVGEKDDTTQAPSETKASRRGGRLNPRSRLHQGARQREWIRLRTQQSRREP